MSASEDAAAAQAAVTVQLSHVPAPQEGSEAAVAGQLSHDAHLAIGGESAAAQLQAALAGLQMPGALEGLTGDAAKLLVEQVAHACCDCFVAVFPSWTCMLASSWVMQAKDFCAQCDSRPAQVAAASQDPEALNALTQQVRKGHAGGHTENHCLFAPSIGSKVLLWVLQGASRLNICAVSLRHH
jgi:hypothetical protein